MEKDKSGRLTCDACCGEHSCYRGTYGGMWFVALRWVLLIIILLITFLFGVKMGELKSGFWGDDYGMGRRGYKMMDNYYRQGQNVPQMMQYYGGDNSPATSGSGNILK